MELHAIGRLLVIIGGIVLLLGILLLLLARIPFLGNLPGDFRLEGSGFSCFIPIASMILVSLLLTLILNIVIRFINRP